MYCFLTLLVIALVFTLKMVQPYLLAVTMGGILALIAFRPYQNLRDRRVSPNIASLTITLSVVLLIIGPIIILTVLAVKQGISIGQSIAQNENFSIPTIFDRIAHWSPVQSLVGSPEDFQRQSRTWIQSAGRTFTGGVLGVAASIPEGALQLTLAAISCFFFLLDGKRFIRWLTNKIPLNYEVRESLITSFKSTAVSVIWATLAAAGAQAALMLVSYLILGVPAAFLAAGATFIFAWIPMVGSVPVWIVGAIYLYANGSIAKVIIMIILGFITGVVDNFVRPLVLKGRGEMHPLVSLVAIFGGIQMFGLIGVFMGPILVAVLISLLQVWPTVGQKFGLIPVEGGLVSSSYSSQDQDELKK